MGKYVIAIPVILNLAIRLLWNYTAFSYTFLSHRWLYSHATTAEIVSKRIRYWSTLFSRAGVPASPVWTAVRISLYRATRHTPAVCLRPRGTKGLCTKGRKMEKARVVGNRSNGSRFVSSYSDSLFHDNLFAVFMIYWPYVQFFPGPGFCVMENSCLLLLSFSLWRKSVFYFL